MSALKKILACGLVAVSMFAFTACGDSDKKTSDAAGDNTSRTESQVSETEPENGDTADTDPEKQAVDAVKLNKDIKPGAKINFQKDKSGNAGFTYENEDGSGGGGVVID